VLLKPKQLEVTNHLIGVVLVSELHDAMQGLQDAVRGLPGACQVLCEGRGTSGITPDTDIRDCHKEIIFFTFF
jgi:hypothetical protein